MSRTFISEHAHDYPVTRLCQLVEVPRSSYYEWRSRPLSDHDVDDAWLANDVFDIHVASRCTYGSPRVAGQLRNRGWRHSRKRIARIMAECGLVGVHGRRKWRRGRRDTAPAGDLLERDFTAERSNQRWVADITEFHCRLDGKLYLAGIKDLCDLDVLHLVVRVGSAPAIKRGPSQRPVDVSIQHLSARPLRGRHGRAEKSLPWRLELCERWE